jgi:hypothetical protein
VALIDVRCLTCGTVFEAYRAAADWPTTPPCEKCTAPTEQVHFPKGTDITAPAVVLYKAPDGSFRFPGSDDPHGRTAQKYAKLGYERVELRGFAEVRRVESQVNKQQASEIRRRVERQCEQREAGMAIKRSDVRHGMEQGFQLPERDDDGRPTGRMKTVRLSERGRDLMRTAMARNDGKARPKAWESGFHVDVYSNSRSNRDESRRPDGRRYRD